MKSSAWGEETELVALRVGEDRPRDIVRAEVDGGGAERPQSGRLGLQVVTRVRAEVEMDPVPHGLHIGRAEELQVWADALGGAQYRVVVGYLVHGPVHGPAPEAGHGGRIRAVDHDRRDRSGVSV